MFKLYNYYCATIFWKLRRHQIAEFPLGLPRADGLDEHVNMNKKGIKCATIQAGAGCTPICFNFLLATLMQLGLVGAKHFTSSFCSLSFLQFFPIL
jgi:hypothetical protein